MDAREPRRARQSTVAARVTLYKSGVQSVPARHLHADISTNSLVHPNHQEHDVEEAGGHKRVPEVFLKQFEASRSQPPPVDGRDIDGHQRRGLDLAIGCEPRSFLRKLFENLFFFFVAPAGVVPRWGEYSTLAPTRCSVLTHRLLRREHGPCPQSRQSCAQFRTRSVASLPWLCLSLFSTRLYPPPPTPNPLHASPAQNAPPRHGVLRISVRELVHDVVVDVKADAVHVL